VGPLEFLIVLLVVCVYIVPLWRIARKMGYPGPLAILACLPGVNMLLAYVLAFTKWPVERELETLRGRVR
jgi:hypothetical protein